MTNKKAPKKSSALVKHTAGQCGCSSLVNPNKCVYQPFLDGWEFTPDVGNGQKRGEIFTPRFIVDKMITDAGILPSEAVYGYVYDTTPRSLEQAFDKRVIEPAIGTGNFTSTICYHRMRYAVAAATSEGVVDDEALENNIIRAVSTLYGFDIDPGNIEVTVRRLLDGEKSELNSDETIDMWTGIIADLLPEPYEKAVKEMVSASLKDAKIHWQRFLKGTGIISQTWTYATGEELPDDLYDHLAEILEANFQVFNGLEKTSTSTMPGSDVIQWVWWDQGGEFLKLVPHQR